MLKKHEVRLLLDIRHRGTINEDLKVLGLHEQEEFSWSQFKKLLEMRLFLGLKPGINSREEFVETPSEVLQELFFGRVNVDEQMSYYQSQYKEQQTTHRVTVQLVLDRE